MRILIVDNDDLPRTLRQIVLSHAGYGMDCAADGEEALALLADEEFDLVLTDRNLPRLDGCDLVRAMRAYGFRTPVMMVSGSLADGGDLPADIRCEIAVALPKPATTRGLLTGIARALHSASAAAPVMMNTWTPPTQGPQIFEARQILNR